VIPMTAREREELDRIRKSLGDWALADIKRAASQEVDLPRLAFIGLAAWLDTVSYLYAPKPKDKRRKKGLNAWLEFLPRYTRYKSDEEVKLLCDGLRNALLHEYGTRGVALTDARPQHHLKQHGEVRVLNLDDLVAECEAAFAGFCADIENDDEIRARVLPRSAGLLAPVELAAGTQASVSSSLSLITPSASATGADGSVFFGEGALGDLTFE
jgi:hypothetical protein